jgi:phage/plasmid-associated DNA primase
MNNTLKKEELFEIKKDKQVFKPFPQICKLLRDKTFLKYSKMFPSTKEYFIYNDKEGIYIKHDEEQFKSVVGRIFTELDIEPDYYKITKICNHFKVGPLAVHTNNVQIDLDFICLNNGIYKLSTSEFMDFSPTYFITSKLKFNYDKTAEIGPIFKDYLKTFCNDNLEKELFLRSWFKILICKYKGTQTFLYIQGQAKTGKSLLGHLASCMIGDQGTVVTSLRSLNNDPFEIYNLKDKHLVIVSDTEYYSGDLSILKQLVGGDPLKGRMKFVQGNMDIYMSGLLLIIGNYGINSHDSSGALQRRMRLFKADNVIKDSRPLLYRQDLKWGGMLTSELPGIFNWITHTDLNNSIKILENPKLMIPSVSSEMENNSVSLDPLLSWVKENLQPGKGSYVGFCNLSLDTKDLLEMRRRNLLYPNYALFCKQRGYIPLKHLIFSTQLVITLSNNGYIVSKVRHKEGVYIQGISLKPESFQTDTMYGGPITYDVEPIDNPKLNPKIDINPAVKPEFIDILTPEIDTKNNINSSSQPNFIDILNNSPEIDTKNNINSSLQPNFIPVLNNISGELKYKNNINSGFKHDFIYVLDNNSELSMPVGIDNLIYKQYINLLSQTTGQKKLLNSFIRKALPENITLVNEFFKDNNSEINQNYKDLISETFQKNLKLISKYGAIPYKYKRMGLSPRIIPVNYGETLNSTKRVLRNNVFSIMSSHLNDYSIVDFDLKSCYISILLGLYPEPLGAIRKAIEGPGLWNYIKSEFIKKGRENVFNKPAVKICVYSSLFLGGSKAMIEGIIDSLRKDIGMTKPDFRKSIHYEPSYSLAQEVSSEMMNSGVVIDLRHIADIIKAQYIDKEFICPTNQIYKVTEENFRFVFPNYLQSYEISLLGLSSLAVYKKYPEVQFIGHYHDGNVLLIPNSILEEVITYYKQQVTLIGMTLKLAYKQELEVKEIF